MARCWVGPRMSRLRFLSFEVATHFRLCNPGFRVPPESHPLPNYPGPTLKEVNSP